MAYKDSHSKASTTYNQRNTVRLGVNLNRNTDADLIVWMEKIQNKQGYIKSLIRNDMGNNK